MSESHCDSLLFSPHYSPSQSGPLLPVWCQEQAGAGMRCVNNESRGQPPAAPEGWSFMVWKEDIHVDWDTKGLGPPGQHIGLVPKALKKTSKNRKVKIKLYRNSQSRTVNVSLTSGQSSLDHSSPNQVSVIRGFAVILNRIFNSTDHMGGTTWPPDDKLWIRSASG